MNISDVSILNIEDDETVREIVSSFIRTQYPSTSVYSAGSAEEGLELFQKHRPAIIITDIHLNESDGIKMARAIRKLDANTVIIFISGCADLEQLSELECGAACHFICKPLNYHDLFALLDNYIHIIVHNRLSGDEIRCAELH